MFSISKNFLFVHIPKTAGNAIQNILRWYSADNIDCPTPFHDGIERFGVSSNDYPTEKHSTLADYRDAYDEALFDGLFKFAAVRNPWDRLISYYFSPFQRQTEWDRNSFMELAVRIPSMCDFLRLERESGASLLDNLDYLMRYESIEGDFAEVCARLEIPFQTLPVVNKSASLPYQHYYDDELVEFVADLCQEDIETFGYRFEPRG